MPEVPTTVWSPDDVIVNWITPDNGGSPITGYIVTIRQSDGVTFTSETSNCNMISSPATTCTIPVTALKAAPFSLPWGSHVFAKVRAINKYGSSADSFEANGAMITTNPDHPIILSEVYTSRTPTTIGLIWEPAAFTGGDVIIDYRVNIAVQGESSGF